MILPTLFLLLSALRIIVECHCDNVPTSEFSKQSICDVTQRIAQGCAKRDLESRSLAECAYVCDQQDSCMGASWTKDQGKCYLHQECTASVGKCKVESTNHRFMAKPCKHGAAWNNIFQYCKCSRGMHGTMCENYPQNCTDYLESTNSADVETITIDPFQNGTTLFTVLCSHRSPLKERIFVLRNEGWANFNRTYNEYINGFYIDNNNLFIGLDSLHQLSTYAGYNSLEVYVQFDDPKAEASMSYSSFKIKDKDNGYKFSYSKGESGSVVADFIPTGTSVYQCFYLNRNQKFSTWDHDTDAESAKNCAAKSGSGWWFPHAGRRCSRLCNLQGFNRANWGGKDSLQRMSINKLNVYTYASRIKQLAIDIVKD